VRPGYSRSSLTHLLEEAGLDVETIRFTFGPFGTLMFDLFFAAGDNRPNPVVYAALLPVYLGLSALDLAVPARRGAAILGVARRPADGLCNAVPTSGMTLRASSPPGFLRRVFRRPQGRYGSCGD
jgi:hypothetical protein